jgi:hypothetical protein
MLETGYMASVTPPHAGVAWQTQQPVSAAELVDKLRDLGCTQADIGDAFFKADPSWLERTFR